MASSTAVGLDIGTTSVRVAQVTFTRTGARLEALGEVELPSGAVERGAVVDSRAVSRAIQQLWRTAKITSRSVCLGVADRRVVVRQVDLPPIPAKDLARALPYQVADLLPIAVESAVLDFHHLADVTGANGEPLMRGFLVAAPRELVMEAVGAAEAAGLRVVSVDLNPFALLRAAGTHLDLEVQTEAIIDIGAQVTNIVVHSAGAPRFVRILLAGGHDVTDTISAVLGLGTHDAEVLKRRTGLPAPRAAQEYEQLSDEPASPVAPDAGSAQGASPDPSNAAAEQAVEEGTRDLFDGIRASLDHYRATVPNHPIERVVVTGGGSLLPGLPANLSEAIRLPVIAGDPLRALAGATVDTELAVRSVVSVGLSLGAGR